MKKRSSRRPAAKKLPGKEGPAPALKLSAWTLKGMPHQIGRKLYAWMRSGFADLEWEARPKHVVNVRAAKTALKNLNYRHDPMETPRKREAKSLARIYKVHPSLALDALWYDYYHHINYRTWLDTGEMAKLLDKLAKENEGLVRYTAEQMGLEKEADINRLRETYLDYQDLIRREMKETHKALSEHKFDEMMAFWTTLSLAYGLAREGLKVTGTRLKDGVKLMKIRLESQKK